MAPPIVSRLNSGSATGGFGFGREKTDVPQPPIPITFNPADGATDVVSNSNIVITFDKKIDNGVAGKYIRLRDGSSGGTILESIQANSAAVTISGAQVTINPTSDFPSLTDVYVVVDQGAFIGEGGAPNSLIDTYNFTSEVVFALGDPWQGGYAICLSGSTVWIIAPSSSEVNRSWYSRNDANSRASAVSGCSGWFVPNCAQGKDPFKKCVGYWDSGGGGRYWTSTEFNGFLALTVLNSTYTLNRDKNNSYPVRSMRLGSYP
jgi:hypothetical protein